MRLILIRHGETDWNVEGRYQGQADPPLNRRGGMQAKQLAKELEDQGIQVLYTSPLLRASQTATIIGQHLKVPVHAEPRLMEIHQGDWQTRLRAEIETLYPDLFSRWQTEPWEVTPPSGEHLKQVQERVDAAMNEIISRHPGETAGVVSHRVPIALIKLRFQGLEADIIRNLHLPNTYYEEIHIPEGGNTG